MRTMHDLATLLNVKLGTLIVEAEELWANETKEKRRPKNPLVAKHAESTFSPGDTLGCFRLRRG
jgi:hypothetical protein